MNSNIWELDRCENKNGRLNGMEFENMSKMNSMMAKEGCEMETEDISLEDKRWMIDDARAIIDGRKREYRKMRRIYGVSDKITAKERIHSYVDLYDTA